MARRPAEIQADIALTRRHIEAQLDQLEQRVTRRGRTLGLVLGGAFVAGLVLSQLPVLRLLRLTASLARAGATVPGRSQRSAAWRRRWSISVRRRAACARPDVRPATAAASGPRAFR